MVLLRIDFLALQNCEFSLSGQRGVFAFCTLYFSSSLESTVIYFCDKAVTTGGSHCWDEFGCQGYTVSAEKHVLSAAQQKAAPDRCLMLPALEVSFQLSRITEPLLGCRGCCACRMDHFKWKLFPEVPLRWESERCVSVHPALPLCPG